MRWEVWTRGKTSIRDAVKTLVSHVVVSDDSAAFAVGQTGINPTAAATSTHVEASTDSDVDDSTADFTVTINGATEMTNKSIFSIGIAKGTAIRQATGAGGTHTGGGTVGTDAISRSVRALGIGVESTDTYALAVRGAIEDNT